MIGNHGTGRTGLLHHFIYGSFKSGVKSDITIDTKIKFLNYKDIKKKVIIWDTVSTKSLNCVRGCHGMFLVFDVTIEKHLIASING